MDDDGLWQEEKRVFDGLVYVSRYTSTLDASSSIQNDPELIWPNWHQPILLSSESQHLCLRHQHEPSESHMQPE